jgi:hypothetical protein
MPRLTVLDLFCGWAARGNSMACNVMRWIGRRIEMVERIP